MAWRSALAASLFVGMALAGCIGSEPDELGTAVVDDQGATTVPPEGRGPIVAFEETNRTEEGKDGLEHHHDYWMGRERVTIFETHAVMRPMNPHQAAEYEAAATFRPPLGTAHLVYEGTVRVEFTISNPERHYCPSTATLNGEYVCTDSVGVPRAPDPLGGPSGLKLRYKHASTTQWIDVGELTWGAPLAIEVKDPTHTDMPHATSSLWEFQVVSPNKHDSTLTFTAKVDIVRGEGNIPLWPGHPDFYADGKRFRVVLEKAGLIACEGSACALAGGAPSGPVYADKLVSYGTRTLFVWANITKHTPGNPATAPTNWFIFNVNATGRDNITNPFDPDHTVDVRELRWVLPVDDNGMDSPYADGSRWNFRLGAALTSPVVSCYAGCADWAATYDLKVVASDLVLDPEAYDTHCLRPPECPDQPEEEEGTRELTRRDSA